MFRSLFAAAMCLVLLPFAQSVARAAAPEHADLFNGAEINWRDPKSGIYEASKSGKPVIASKTRSFEEIQYQSSALKMISPGAPAELALAIEKLMANQAERAELVDKIRAYGQTRTWADYIARLGLKA